MPELGGGQKVFVDDISRPARYFRFSNILKITNDVVFAPENL